MIDRVPFRRAVARHQKARVVRSLLRDVPWLLVREPRLALAIARADPRDATSLPLLDRALVRRRTPALVRRRAWALEAGGEITEARAAWQELADRGDARARRRVRLLDGRIAETDTFWLPRTRGACELLAPSSPRRVLHLVKNSAPERWSGFTIRTLHNLRAQRSAGLEPVVVSEIGWPREAGVDRVEPVVDYEGIPHHRLDRGPGYRPAELPNDVRLLDNAEATVDVVREVRPAILHAHSGFRGGDQALIALALRERFGIPVVYEVRGLFEAGVVGAAELSAGSELYARRLAQETRLMREVDGVLAISEALADDIASRGIPRTKITVIPNGIDPAALDAPVRDPALRGELGLEGRFVVGYLGNLDHWREGIDVLIAALAELRARGRSDVAILVVGDGARRASLEAEARRLGVTDGCRFTGRVPHAAVARYYAQMDVLATPRLEERASRYITPLKPFEAMAVGVPLLVSDLPALREIADPPRRGLTAPPGDARGLADVIVELADDEDLRRQLAAAGRAWVHAERTWASNGPRYRAAYEAIIGPID